MYREHSHQVIHLNCTFEWSNKILNSLELGDLMKLIRDSCKADDKGDVDISERGIKIGGKLLNIMMREFPVYVAYLSKFWVIQNALL